MGSNNIVGKVTGEAAGFVNSVTRPAGSLLGAPLGGIGEGVVGPAQQARAAQVKDRSAFDLDRFGAQYKQTRADDLSRAAQRRGESAQRERTQLIEQLQGRASGQTPSLAEAQLRAAQDRSLAQQLAAARGARGGNQAALQRALVRQQGQTAAELAQQGAEARMAEQQQAQQQLGQMIVQEQQLADQLAQNYLAQGFTIAQARQQAQADLEKTNLGIANQTNLANLQARIGNQEAVARVGGSLFEAAGTVGAGFASQKSDKNSKKDIKKADKEVKSFLDALQAYSYNYKNPKEKGASKGKSTSVMAQDLEKSSIGKSFVEKMSDGKKGVNYAKGFGAIVAAQAHLNKRLNELESKKKGK